LFERLERQPNLLTRSERHPIGRHQSLRAAIESSDRLLTGVERKVFYRLSIFANSFDLGAAERVCSVVGDLEPAEVARAVANLIDKSVVVARFDPNGTRYGLLDTVRRYAAEKLPEDDDVAPLRAAHLKWMLDLVSDALADPTLAQTYRHPDSPSVLELEADNIRAVLEWAIENDQPAALELSTRLSVWWRMAGRLAEARHWLETALAANSSDPSGVTAQALVQLGLVIQDQLDTSGSLTIHAQAIEAAQSSRDDELAVMATVGMAQALRDCGDYAEAASFAERALALARNCGERGGQTRALAALAFIELYQGHLDEARVHAGEAVDLVDDLYPSDGAWEAFASSAIANAFASELDAAEAHAVAALALGEALGSAFKVAWTHSTLGTIAASRGNIDGEIDHAQECLELSVAIGSKRTLANALMCLSQACGLAGHFDVGGTLVGATSSLVRRAGFALPPGFDRFTRLDAYSEAFGGDRRVLTAAYHRGRALPAPAVVDLARSVTATGTDGSAGLTRAVDRLTPRERELIGHVAEGLTDAQIGAHLTISLRTVHSHLDRIRDKTGARRRADLTRLAMTLGRAEFKETPSS
jgi:non-specific serine/threonine protein kinase